MRSSISAVFASVLISPFPTQHDNVAWVCMCATGETARVAAKVRQHLSNADTLALGDSGHVKVMGHLGEGRFSHVLLGETERCSQVALKFALNPAWSLSQEAAVLRVMHATAGFPALVHHQTASSTSTGAEMVAMELLGPSLEKLWETTTTSTQFSGPTVLRAGCGVLRCLRSLHKSGFVHNDLKPANVVLGAAGSGREADIHLLDFNLATQIIGGHAPQGALEERVGTPLFASIAAHEGRPTSAADDIESLAYCLSFLATGRLPWLHKRHSKALFMKRRMITDGCEVMTDSCAADALTEDVQASAAVDALQVYQEQAVDGHELTLTLTLTFIPHSSLLTPHTSPFISPSPSPSPFTLTLTLTQALWAEVIAYHETGEEVDYEACLAALDGFDDVPYDWERRR